ncbi:Leucyl aminopeptidase (aminopeptidase T) [Thermanaeromonas toyohensis ToBE]|uniref:Leucyl aminopeptidase (Aminopeptidase T) n=1 Tax=Thermanaeromonas toyohensis ToBE TaxID=698762 RepID=A0A1W1VY74_9FIRM|nr:aminopeptidase [Thermanaeromonas toyohensis]SMB98286.1 Leucyl aminopeptidase (aminopeptidase T) [Thermanaeromonas toyohensis ToBE]
MRDLKAVAQRLLLSCMGLEKGERLLVVTDTSTVTIGEALFQAGEELGALPVLIKISPTGRHGAEPPLPVAAAMEKSDVVICPTKYSLTHTQARLKACEAGARVATMPGITEEMFFEGAVAADYEEVARRTTELARLLSEAKTAVLVKDGLELKLSLEGRRGIASTGLYRRPGEAGNLPSGEAYIAPVEGSAEGETIIDGSIAGIGRLSGPIRVVIKEGVLVEAQGPEGQQLLELLGDSPEARNLAELGIGTNDRAKVSGIILEDEKVYGTVHLAFGDNATFGGRVRAGVHIDGVILTPDLYLDGKLVVSRGKIIL